MSLATDILKRVFAPVDPPAPKRAAGPEPVKPKKPPTTLADCKRGLNRNCLNRKFYGVGLNKKNGTYRARIKLQKNGSINLGHFTKPERAALAVQLYLLWFRRGFIDIPTGKYLTE